MNVLLVEPEKSMSWGKNNQCVGLLRIATYHQAIGDNVQYVVSPTGTKGGLISKDIKFYPDVIYVTSMFTYWYDKVWEAVKLYKNRFPKAKVLLGGIYATISPDHAKMSGADEVMAGQHPQAKEYPPDPSVLPYPQDFAYLFTSFGCNRACTYCATHILYGQGLTQLPPERVVEDIKFVKSKGFRKVYFGDDNILANSSEHINKVCEAIIAKNIKVEIHIPGGMAAKDFTQETADLMYKAGVREISFAIESVSQEVRDKMGRHTNANEEDLRRACEISEKAGFNLGDTNVYFIIGLPYQKIEDMTDTLIFLIRLGVWAHPQRLTPIPNTVDWKRMHLEDWDYLKLHYKEFVAPNQTNFTGEDLDEIYKLARFFNIGLRYTTGYSIFKGGRIAKYFRDNLLK